MNIDQRLEALTQNVELLAHSVNKHDEFLAKSEQRLAKSDERHEALRQTVELLAHSATKSQERHEALRQSVELLAHSVTKHDEILTRHEKFLTRHEKILTRHEEALVKQRTLMDDIMDPVARLANTAGAHQKRLDQQERRLRNLEQ